MSAYVIILNCRNGSLSLQGQHGRDLVDGGHHLVVADGETDGLSMHHELPPRLLTQSDQVIVLLLLFGSQCHSLHFLPPQIETDLLCSAFLIRYMTFDSEFFSALAISSRISFSNASIEDQTVTFCLILASCQILQLLAQMFSWTRAARFRFSDILATKEDRKSKRFKRDDCIIIELLLVMASREQEGVGVGREPQSPRKGKEKQGLEEIRQGYVQITERLTTKVKKPLQNLKAMVEAELQRIRQE